MSEFKAKVRKLDYGEYYDEELPIIFKDELEKIHPKYLVTYRPRAITSYQDDSYVEFYPPPDHRIDDKRCGGQTFAVKVKDYKEVLAKCPHYPNKKESKELRKAKIKKGR